MPRTARPLEPERAARLRSVAAEAFLADGLEGASLNAIIAAAGMGKSSFYHYFADKQALFDHLLTTLAAIIEQEVHPPELGSLTRDTFWPAMRRAIADFERMTREHPETIPLARVYHLPGTGSGVLDRWQADAAGWILAAVERGREVGAVRTDLPAVLLADTAASHLLALDRWELAHAGDPEAEAVADRALTALQTMLEGT